MPTAQAATLTIDNPLHISLYESLPPKMQRAVICPKQIGNLMYDCLKESK